MAKYYRLYLKKHYNPRVANASNTRYSEVVLSSFLNQFYWVPYRCIYTASKRFNKVFENEIGFWQKQSSALRHLDTLTVQPTTTLTPMVNYKSIRAVKAEEVAESILKQMAMRKEVFGPLKHETWALIHAYEPRFLTYARMLYIH